MMASGSWLDDDVLRRNVRDLPRDGDGVRRPADDERLLWGSKHRDPIDGLLEE
jgi:hypothetical protein